MSKGDSVSGTWQAATIIVTVGQAQLTHRAFATDFYLLSFQQVEVSTDW